MPSQAGAQAAGFLIPHDHSDIYHGGILNPYSYYGAYRRSLAGTTVQISNDAEKYPSVPAWALVKETTFTAIPGNIQKGTWRIDFEMSTLSTPTPVYCRVYVNGVQYSGDLADTTGAWTLKTYTLNRDLVPGDKVQIYGYDPSSAGIGVRNFRIRWGWQIPHFGDGSSRVLTAPLAVTDSDNPFTTAITDP